MKFILIILFVCVPYFSFGETIIIPHNIDDFTKAKKLIKKIYIDHQISFYCNCSYDYKQISGKEKTVVNTDSCGYTPRKNKERGRYIEWEHVVPAHAFGSTRECWRESICEDSKGEKFKGRKCCEKIDPVFRAMEADLHNLRPAVGELNADRSNYQFGIISGEEREYGICDFEIKEKTAEPKDDIRGEIARTYFYMENTYGIKISNMRNKLFKIWDKQYLPSDWEKERNERIYKIQGNRNLFIR